MSLPSHATTTQISVGQYLATRLRQLGVAHLFGLPGDFNLGLLDELLSVDGLAWVGTANELNAAYAADGYARIRRGVGALVTTYGVGELSAINGTAGSYAEGVPVIHIVGMPSTAAQANGTLLHHTLADGDFGHFVRAAAEVTVEAVVVTAVGAAGTIDRAIRRALDTSLPIYLGIPADVALLEVSASTLARGLRSTVSDRDQLVALEASLVEVLADDDEVVVLAGPRIHRRHLEPFVSSLATRPGVKVATQNASKALLDESNPANLGVYAGEHTVSADTRRRVDEASTLVLAGVVMSDFLTGFFSHGFDPDDAIELRLDEARVGGDIFYDVYLDDSLALLDRLLAGRAPRDVPVVPDSVDPQDPSPHSRDELLSHATLWPTIEAWLRPGTTVVAEAGTSFYGAVDLKLPDDSELLGQPVWSSIGYTLPATLGAMLATPGRETVLLIGDGSAQLTIQELGTILHRGLTPTILLIDNDGYTVERLIQSPDAPYQDVVRWDWTSLPSS
ncbi:MAG: thiamine pyrophosphate protein binding domain protein, partial [Frondihabitans sp.]|nr:thiamine pyrophosphate protein binding domain protein [Frondihabitans sp.]